MADMIYLIGGYAVFAGVMLVYVYSLVTRQKTIQRDIKMLKHLQSEE